MSYISCSNEFRGTFKFPCLQELSSLLSFSLAIGDKQHRESCLHSIYSPSYIMTETNTFLFSKYNWSLILGRNLKTELRNIICTGILIFVLDLSIQTNLRVHNWNDILFTKAMYWEILFFTWWTKFWSIEKM